MNVARCIKDEHARADDLHWKTAAGTSWVEMALGALERTSPAALAMEEFVGGIVPDGVGSESAHALGRLCDQLVGVIEPKENDLADAADRRTDARV